MSSIRLQNVMKQFGGQVVLADVSLDLHSGQIAALVGANGVGKTTLFRLIAGELTPDIGTVTTSRGLAVGYLPQEPDVAVDTTLRAAVAAAFADLAALEEKLQALSQQIAAEHQGPRLHELMSQYDRLSARFETAGGYTFEQRLSEVLGGLGFTPADYDLPVAALSGGQKCRAALAKLLLQERQFLLLDEPTNHLDIDAVRWLEKFLAGHHGGAVIISHDRYLLDRVAQRTIELTAGPAGGRVQSYSGNYSDYVRTRELHALTQQRQHDQDRAFIEKERDFIARHMAGQRSRQAQGRQKRLERQLAAGEFVLDQPHQRRTVKMEFAALARTPRGNQAIVRTDGLGKQYGDKVLFRDLALEVWGGQRLGMTGPNGTGKTTLLRIILGQVAPEAGTAKLAATARVGYFAQEPDGLDPDKTIVQEICAVRGDFLERDARHYAARFLFTGEDVFKRVGQLSGGEQSRLRFMKLILAAPDLLILDEPTNHLDIAAREALEQALADFPGTVIAVSHDRYFLDQVAEKLLVIRSEEHQLYHGNYSYYIAKVEEAQAAAAAAAQAAAVAARQKQRKTAGSRSRGGAKAAGPRSPFARMPLEELEAYITAREERLEVLHERFGDPAVYRDPAAITQLKADFDVLKAELTAAEQAWQQRAAET